MRYLIVLLLVLGAGFFLINERAGAPIDKITIGSMAADEKKSVEIAARETVKYYKKYHQTLTRAVTINTVSDKTAYQGLLSNKYKLSENAAELVSAGRGFYTGDTIFINTNAANNDLLRSATVAHELTHHYQNQLSPQYEGLLWLQEGMADAAACDILEQSGLAKIQPLPVKQLKLPVELNLADLDTEENWLAAVDEYGANAVYAYSALAVRRLISQKDFQSFFTFYQELNTTQNVEESFKKAFGMELNEYQEKFSQYVQSDKDIYYYNYYR